jgi:hypothetical protein
MFGETTIEGLKVHFAANKQNCGKIVQAMSTNVYDIQNKTSLNVIAFATNVGLFGLRIN